MLKDHVMNDTIILSYYLIIILNYQHAKSERGQQASTSKCRKMEKNMTMLKQMGQYVQKSENMQKCGVHGKKTKKNGNDVTTKKDH